MKEKDFAYMAGLLEGEGHIGVARIQSRKPEWAHQYAPRVSVGMTDREPVDWCAEKWGTRVLEQQDSRPNTLQSYVAKMPVPVMKELLPHLLPHVKSRRKRREIDIVLVLTRRIRRGGPPLSLSELKYRHWLWEEAQRVKLGLSR